MGENKMDVMEESEDRFQDSQRSTRSTKQPRSFEDVFVAMGPPGRYQVVQIMMILTCLIPMTFVIFKYIFISLQPRHRCSKVTRIELFKEIQVPSNETDLYNVWYNESCLIEIMKNESETWTPFKSIDCINGREFDGGEDVSFITEWDLVCDSEGIPQLAQTVISIGAFVGSIISNTLADKYGRWKVITISISLTVAVEIATAFAPEIYSFIIIRLLTGFVASGMYVTCYVLAFEMVVSKYRVMFAMINGALWSLCVMFLSGLAYAFRNYDWREFQLYTAIICIFPLFFMHFVKESAMWLYTVGNKPRAEEIIQKACNMNGIEYDLVKGTLEECFEEEKIKDLTQSFDLNGASSNTSDLFKSKKYLKIVVIAWFIYFSTEMTNSGLNLSASSLVGNLYLNLAILAATGIPGCLANWILLKYKGRRFVIILFIVITSVCLPISSFIEHANVSKEITSKISLVFFVLGKFAIAACNNTLHMYIPEIFPTNVRSSGTGIAFSGASVGGCIAPYLLPMKKIASWAPGTSLAVCCFLSSLLLLKLPETKGRQLAAILDDDFVIIDEDDLEDDEEYTPGARESELSRF